MFGPKTNRAVKAFQKSQKLHVDGIVGPETWRSLFNNGGSSSSHSYPGHLVKYGDRGTAVKEVQHQLNAVGDNVGNADGVFGPKTLKGVKAFQKAQGLSVDGIIGPKTWNALFKKSHSEAPSGGFHHPNHWNQNSVLREGDSGKEVKNLQYILTVMTFYTKSEGVTEDGIFGPKTKHAVEVYQKGQGLQPDGIVGPKTWNSLSKFIHKKNPTTYSAGGYMGLRLEWKYDNTSDNSGCTVTVYGDGDHKTDSYRLSPDR
ncbi:MAG TPA: peptidoglycan-binding protein [Bacillales bacterium]|nr:peptidoglycan-binding protein [Bacillales bacterium]